MRRGLVRNLRAIIRRWNDAASVQKTAANMAAIISGWRDGNVGLRRAACIDAQLI